MIIIISPAKKMELSPMNEIELTAPIFLKEAELLHSNLVKLQPWELEGLMKINPKLAMETYIDIKNWDKEMNGTPALAAYCGLQYQNMELDSFNKEDWIHAQKHLRILSGFYGILRPTDCVKPYRLEMQLKWTLNGTQLYEFWNRQIFDELAKNNTPILNLASKEYSKVVSPYINETTPLITCNFLIERGGKKKTLATSAKMARGRMVQYIIKNKLSQIEEIKQFTWDGYEYIPELSNRKELVFLKRDNY